MQNSKWVAGLLAAVTLLQASAHADIISDLPGFDDNGSQGQTFRPPPPPTNNTGVIRQYSDVANLDQISRKSGGEAYRFNLARPTVLKHLELTVQASRLKIHEATVMTVSGQRYVIREFHNSNVLDSGTVLSSESLNSNEDIRAIELRLESYSQAATISLKAVGERDVPRMSVQRPVIVAPPGSSTQPSQPTQPVRNVDTRLRAGDVVLSMSASSNSKFYDGRVVEVYQNGKVLVRDNDDGKTYVRDISKVGKRISCAANGLCERERVMAYPVGNQAKSYLGSITAIYSNDLVKMLDDDDGKVYGRAAKNIFKSVRCSSSGLCIKDRVVSKGSEKYYFGTVTGVYSNGLVYVQDDDDSKFYARSQNVVFKDINCGKGFCRGDRVLSSLSNGRFYAGRVFGVYANGMIAVTDDDDGKTYMREHTVLSRAR